MKLVRFQKDRRISFGILEESGKISELLNPPWENLEETGASHSYSEVVLLAPAEPRDLIAIGLNYSEHAKESGAALPQEPVFFLKASASAIGTGAPIKLPEMAPAEVDYEAELGIVIGHLCHNVESNEALDYVLGYTCGNDVSARDCQRRRDTQWARAKSFATFCPLGPWVETQLDPGDLQIRLNLNGSTMQESRTSDMIFNCQELISFCSKIFPLRPGTVILTGTPPGVGFARNPPIFLKPGDFVEVEIEGIGKLGNPVS